MNSASVLTNIPCKQIHYDLQYTSLAFQTVRQLITQIFAILIILVSFETASIRIGLYSTFLCGQ
jgi:hypothetical protein